MPPIDPITLIGFAAATLTTLAFLPQVYKTWRSRSAQDLSYLMLLTFTSGVLLWLVYGLYLQAWPIILANIVTFGLNLWLIILKVHYSRTGKDPHL